MGNLGHSNPELYSSATHFDVLGRCGDIDPREKRPTIRSHAHAGDRQTVKSTADVCVCVCVRSPVQRIHWDANTAPLSDWNHELQG